MSSSSSSNKNKFNPFQMVGDVASNLLGTGNVQAKASVDHAVMEVVQTMSWETIREQLEAQIMKEGDEEERNFRSNLSKGYGRMGSPLHKVRLFDESNKEEDIRVVFYRDSASWWWVETKHES